MNSEVNAKAIEFLEEYGITKLPVDTEKIAIKMGCKIISPSTALRFQSELGFSSEELGRECWSFIFHACDYIVLSPTLAPDQRQNYIAHEIGHRALGHIGTGNLAQQEEEADAFARYLRAPVSVLDKLTVDSPKDVATLTGLDAAASQIVYRDLLAYREKKKEVQTAEKAGGKFKGAIFKGWAKKHKTAITILLTAVVLTGIFAAILALQTPDQPTTPDSPTSDNQSIPDQIPSELQNQTPAAPSIPDESDPDDDPPAGTVYWTDAGRVYHLYDDCQHIKNSIQVFSGPESMAEDEGKKDVCKTCLSRSMSSK